ncbi:MAG: hypothetical protein LBK69_08090 [Syntrophomonadaceae bacterium]|jgi:hypothetical protein|nr:hypothetical protein [Syntrophomonadaceae bacterium]
MNKLLFALSSLIVIKEAIPLFKNRQWKEIFIISALILLSVYLAFDLINQGIIGQTIDKVLRRYS